MSRLIHIVFMGAALAGCHMFEDIDAIEGTAPGESTDQGTTNTTVEGDTDTNTDGNTGISSDDSIDSKSHEDTDTTIATTTDPSSSDNTDTSDNTDPTTHDDTEPNTGASTDSITEDNTDTGENTDSIVEEDTDIDTVCVEGGRKSGEFCDLDEYPCNCDNVCSEEFFGTEDDYIYYCYPKCRDGDCGYLGHDFACMDKPKLGIGSVCAGIGGMEPTAFAVPVFYKDVTPTSASTDFKVTVAGYPEIPILTNGFALSTDADVTFVFIGLPAKDFDIQYWRLEIVVPRKLYGADTLTADYNGIKGFKAHLYRVRTDVNYFESIAMAMEGGSLTLTKIPAMPCAQSSSCTSTVMGTVQLDLVGLGFGFPTPKL